MRKRASTVDKRRRRSDDGKPSADRIPEERERRRQKRGSIPNPCEVGFRFDPYWDEVFAAYYDPTMGTCCRR